MADESNQDPSAPQENDPVEDQSVPFEIEDIEEVEDQSIPRRAASAQFVVQSEFGSEAAMREAMDPANQSLADALKLSFRILQIVIVALLMLFIFSGFQSVDAKESGVMLRWGKIVSSGDTTALTPGPHWTIWPYPAGEFVIFETQDRNVNLRKPISQRLQNMMVEPFWPLVPPNVTRDQAIDNATVSASIDPANGGSVLTRDGDIAHLRISSKFDIDEPVVFVQTLSLEDAEQAVSLALRRGVVHVVAETSLQELIDFPDDIRMRVQTNAQSTLDKFGITLVKVTIIETSPPFAIAKEYGELPATREQAKQSIQKAIDAKEARLTDLAGESYKQLVQLIESYEDAEKQGSDQDPEKVLAQINAFLDGEVIGGGLKQVIDRARAHDADIDLVLGAEVRRFKRILPEYRNNPKLTIDRRWLEAYQTVMRRPDTEVMYMPEGLGELYIKIKTLEEVAMRQQKILLDKKMRQTGIDAMTNRAKYYQRAEDYDLNSAIPILTIENGKVISRTADDE